MRLFRTLLLIGPLLLWGPKLRADNGPAEGPRAASAAPLFIGITALGNPSLKFSTVNDYLNGVSVDHNTVRLSVALGVAWSLQMRVLDDLRYQTYSIPASAIGVQVTNIGTRPEVFLSTTSQTIASGIANLLLNTNVTIRYRARGGAAFLKPSGNYTTTLVLTYTGL